MGVGRGLIFSFFDTILQFFGPKSPLRRGKKSAKMGEFVGQCGAFMWANVRRGVSLARIFCGA